MATISQGLTYMFIGGIILATPEFLNIIIPAISPEVLGNANSSGIANNSVPLITHIISILFLLCGVSFFVKAFIVLYQHALGDTGYEISATNISSKLKKTELIEFKENINLLDMEDEELNHLVKNITTLIAKIISMPAIDSENKQIVEQIMDNYLPKITKSYVAIPMKLRNYSVDKKLTAKEMTKAQLTTLFESVEKIQLEVLNNQCADLRVMGNILKEKFPKDLPRYLEATSNN